MSVVKVVMMSTHMIDPELTYLYHTLLILHVTDGKKKFCFHSLCKRTIVGEKKQFLQVSYYKLVIRLDQIILLLHGIASHVL